MPKRSVGQSWTLDAKGQLVTPGTQVLILEQYDFKAPAPWLLPAYWTKTIVLPDRLTVLT